MQLNIQDDAQAHMEISDYKFVMFEALIWEFMLNQSHIIVNMLQVKSFAPDQVNWA